MARIRRGERARGAMKKWLQLALGIVTSVGGFFDAGAMASSVQAGAVFRFQLIWALLLGMLVVIFLVEMSGRFSAASGRTLPDALRESFGFSFWLGPFVVLTGLHLLVLASEIGGVCFALHLLTGLPLQLLALPVALLIWVFLWRATFAAIEYSTSLLGMITLAFVVAAVRLHPRITDLVAGALPSLPTEDHASYWFLALSIIGAALSPYLFYFYSSGAVEDRWDASYIGVNRGIAVLGMGFGSLIALAAIVVAALVLGPQGIHVDDFHQAALMLTTVFPFWGYTLFAVSMGIACLGGALEVALSLAYTSAQTFGWNWGEDLDPRSDARFSLTYTVGLVLAGGIIAVGFDPLRITLWTLVMGAAVMPIVAVPFLLLMNDAKLLGKHTNGPVANLVTVLIVVLSLALFVVAIPLAVLGGS
jgi:Mn2+/Fe2+ NRAMP family transporter